VPEAPSEPSPPAAAEEPVAPAEEPAAPAEEAPADSPAADAPAEAAAADEVTIQPPAGSVAEKVAGDIKLSASKTANGFAA
jgi:hypothetical protein